MKKLFCDWCGKEIGKKGKVYNATTIDFPALVIPYKNGEPCGEAEFDWENPLFPHTERYDVCLDCVRKIWGMRHDQT